jgi:nitrite reductase/ring-hydroxylating ferredoxin subunit
MSKQYKYKLASMIQHSFEGTIMESGYVRVADTSEIPIGKTKKVIVQGKEILLANVNGIFYAISNVCTHERGDLSASTLEGTIVTCPKHKSKFDVTTGKVVSGPKMMLLHPKIADEPAYTVKTDGADILIKL